jgi:hypothetical protein
MSCSSPAACSSGSSGCCPASDGGALQAVVEQREAARRLVGATDADAQHLEHRLDALRRWGRPSASLQRLPLGGGSPAHASTSSGSSWLVAVVLVPCALPFSGTTSSPGGPGAGHGAHRRPSAGELDEDEVGGRAGFEEASAGEARHLGGSARRKPCRRRAARGPLAAQGRTPRRATSPAGSPMRVCAETVQDQFLAGDVARVRAAPQHARGADDDRHPRSAAACAASSVVGNSLAAGVTFGAGRLIATAVGWAG